MGLSSVYTLELTTFDVQWGKNLKFSNGNIDQYHILDSNLVVTRS